MDPLGQHCSVPVCNSAERAMSCTFGVVQHVPTPHRSTALELTGMEPQSHSQARDPRDPGEGAWWQQGKCVWLERNMTFQCYPWSTSTDSTGHLRDLTSDTYPWQMIQLTAWGGFSCQSPPGSGCKDQSSKCHSSSVVNPCLSRVRSYTVSSQPLEMHRDCALSGRLQAATCHNTTHKETQARAFLCQAGLLPALHNPTSSPEPVTAVGQVSQGCLTPSGSSKSSPRSQAGPVPPAAVTISLLTPQPRWKHRQEQNTSCPGRAGGASKAMTEQSLLWGQGCHGTNTAEWLHEHESWMWLPSAPSPGDLGLAGRLRAGGGIRASCGVRGKAAGKISSAAMP